MYIDALTLAGLACIASYALMPILMRREFIRVSPDALSSTESGTAKAERPCPSKPLPAHAVPQPH